MEITAVSTTFYGDYVDLLALLFYSMAHYDIIMSVDVATDTNFDATICVSMLWTPNISQYNVAGRAYVPNFKTSFYSKNIQKYTKNLKLM